MTLPITPDQDIIDHIGSQLYFAYSEKRADLCADCYEPYGILHCKEHQNIIGRDEIATYWACLIQAGKYVTGRSSPQLMLTANDALTVRCQWFLIDGSVLNMQDTWAKQQDNSFKLLIQKIIHNEGGV